MMPYGRKKLRQEIRAHLSQSRAISLVCSRMPLTPTPGDWGKKSEKKGNSSNLPSIAVRGKHTFKEWKGKKKIYLLKFLTLPTEWQASSKGWVSGLGWKTIVFLAQGFFSAIISTKGICSFFLDLNHFAIDFKKYTQIQDITLRNLSRLNPGYNILTLSKVPHQAALISLTTL